MFYFYYLVLKKIESNIFFYFNILFTEAKKNIIVETFVYL